MTKETALSLIKEYQTLHTGLDDTLRLIFYRFPEDGSERKAMRWLGFVQGILFEREVFTLQELKLHSKRGYVFERKGHKTSI